MVCMGCEAETDVSALMLLWRLLILQPSMLSIWCEVLLGGTFQDLSFVGAYNYPDQWINGSMDHMDVGVGSYSYAEPGDALGALKPGG